MTTNDGFTALTAPPTATTVCALIGRYEISNDEICEYLAYCKPREVIGGSVMLARGETNRASMEESDFQKWWIHRHQVPSELMDSVVVFPKATDTDGFVRYAVRSDDDWRLSRGDLGHRWDAFGVLVRFRKKRA